MSGIQELADQTPTSYLYSKHKMLALYPIQASYLRMHFVKLIHLILNLTIPFKVKGLNSRLSRNDK